MTALPVYASFPDKPIRIIVPFAAGGPTDAVARSVAQGLSDLLRQTVLVENKPGGMGLIGTQAVLNAPRDGYTLLMTTNSTQILAPILKKPAPFDAVEDFVPIGRAAKYPIYVVANAGTPFNDLMELQRFAKANPRRVSYASAGIGSIGSLSCELLADVLGIDFLHVPYKGSAPAIQAVIGNEVQLSCDSIPNAQAHVKSGRLKALVLMGEDRSPDAPNVPTTKEIGFPGLELTYTWIGFFAPAKTPKPVVDQIGAAFRAVLNMQEFQARTRAASFETVIEPSLVFKKALQTERAIWERIIKNKNITVD